ncbi:unnamed protein product [Soboliphyme baturini]|uniref:NAD-dependent protein deacetylase sir-2.1 n=1 Tax=Soboliphyme baturini TaxID=241478 RepID=A0A183IHV8_9BILA|nr:unnamed protein product [Soboliphyme baturini]
MFINPILSGYKEWIREQVGDSADPRVLLRQMAPDMQLTDAIDDDAIWELVFKFINNEIPRRPKLTTVNTLDDAVALIKQSKKIIVLTGAGISVSCGIPDFRSRGGVYARLRQRFPELPDPQAVFDINFFRNNPSPFFEFAKEIYPGQFKPSLCHRFIKTLEDENKLLRDYTQNIDTLEQTAGIKKVIYCHDIFNQVIPELNVPCSIMKPDIVFFGESLPREFHECIARDKEAVDLLVVMGSSMKVRPVAFIPDSVPGHVPQIFINREPLDHMKFDVELYGNCDDVVNELCARLGGSFAKLCFRQKRLTECREVHVDSNGSKYDGIAVAKKRKVMPEVGSVDLENAEKIPLFSTIFDDAVSEGESPTSSLNSDEVSSSSQNDVRTKDIRNLTAVSGSDYCNGSGSSSSDSEDSDLTDVGTKCEARSLPLGNIASALPGKGSRRYLP